MSLMQYNDDCVPTNVRLRSMPRDVFEFKGYTQNISSTVDRWTLLESEQADIGTVLDLNAGDLKSIERTWTRLDGDETTAYAPDRGGSLIRLTMRKKATAI